MYVALNEPLIMQNSLPGEAFCNYVQQQKFMKNNQALTDWHLFDHFVHQLSAR